MALVVEDGTGLATAQSYISVANAATYLAAKGDATWAAATDAARESALVRATAYLDAAYASRWPGFRYCETQALAWPRVYAYDVDGFGIASTTIPTALKNATCEAAVLELAEAGVLSKKAEGGLKSIKIGSIEKTWAGSSAPGATSYPAIRQALARIVGPGGGNIAIGGR